MNIKESFYQKLQAIREEKLEEMTGGFPRAFGQPRERDIPGSGVTRQPSGAQLTTPSQIKPTQATGETGTAERIKGAIKSVQRAGNEAMGLSPLGLAKNMPVMNQPNPKLPEGMKPKK